MNRSRKMGGVCLASENLIFRLDHAEFAYPYEEPVLRDITLSVREGEKLCILGANGCGKSTLLKIFAGLLLPQKGSFSAFGEKITEKMLNDDCFSKAYHRRVGFIFQNSEAQLFCSTVEEEIAFGPLQLGFSTDEVKQRISDISDLLNMKHLLSKPPFKLSGGEKKKVALACVLVMNPDVLILDEPTNGLDPRTQAWLVGLLVTLNQAGKTILTTTHNLELVQKLSDRAILFSEDHRIVADRPTEVMIRDGALLREVNLVGEDYSI
jgi:cobalt/nickel transport system ATP-binding protein